MVKTMIQKRYLAPQIVKDMSSKMVFLGGPRQVGKTTLSQSLFKKYAYLNWDDSEDRERILKKELPLEKIWIFDEIHKYKQWRNFLKGLYDKNKSLHQFLITGSARLDFYRFGGDSLQGRYHFLRLHPLSFDELKTTSFNDFETLFKLGGFPEPFFGGQEIEAKRWSREYRNRILRDDISSVERISDLGQAEMLLLRLPELVGSPLSINSLTEDLQISFKTLQRWVNIYERFYAIFRLSPFGSPKIKAIKKEQKHYHFDWTLIKDEGLRFENMMACQFLKWTHFFEDTEGRDIELRYFRDQEQREVDFAVLEEGKPLFFVECKRDSHQVTPHLKYLHAKFPKVPCYQLTYHSKKDFVTENGIRVVDAYKVTGELLDLLRNPQGN